MPVQALRTAEAQSYPLSTSAQDEGGWSTSHPGRFTPGEKAGLPTLQEAVRAPRPVWTGVKKKNLHHIRLPPRSERIICVVW